MKLKVALQWQNFLQQGLFQQPEFYLWLGCAVSFEPIGAKKLTQAFVKDFKKKTRPRVSFCAVLGTEESCTGDPAKRAGT